MKILIAPDKFKGSLSAQAVIDAIATGIKAANPGVTIMEHPMADGGDGSLEVLKSTLKLSVQAVRTVDPLGRPLLATYLRNEKQAFIELASASGLVVLKKEERNPLQTSTYGTGLMIRHAIQLGVKEVYLFLGGSATNDLGLGIAVALGFQLLNAEGESLSPIGGNLTQINQLTHHTDITDGVQFRLLCDVNNPTFGVNGAAYIYAHQKGARPHQIETLDQGLVHTSQIIKQQFGVDLKELPGGGAAGGVGAGLYALFDAQLNPGFQTISQLTGFEERLKEADVVICGEGKLDGQSLSGKVVDGVAALCRKYEKPLYIFAGTLDLSPEQLRELKVEDVYAVIDRAKNMEDAMGNGTVYLTEMASEIRL